MTIALCRKNKPDFETVWSKSPPYVINFELVISVNKLSASVDYWNVVIESYVLKASPSCNDRTEVQTAYHLLL